MKIDIKESDKPLIIEFFKSKLRIKRSAIEDLNKECLDIEQTLSQLEDNETNTQGNSDYNITASMKDKIVFVLNENSLGKMPTRDITERLLKLEPTINEDKGKLLKSVSTVLSINNGKVFEREEINNEFVYKLKR